MQQHCTPRSIHGAVKLKVTCIGFTPASITAAPCTETPTGVSLHTRASTSPVVPMLQPLSCWRCSVVGFPHTRHSACKKVLEFPNIVLSKVSKIRGWATASTRIPVAPYAGATKRFHNCRQHLPPACGTKAAASWRSSWVGAQLSCCSWGDAAPAPDTFNHNYMGQIVSASSRQCRKSRSTLTLPTTGRVTSLQQNNIHTHPEPFRNILKWKPWGT